MKYTSKDLPKEISYLGGKYYKEGSNYYPYVGPKDTWIDENNILRCINNNFKTEYNKKFADLCKKIVFDLEMKEIING